MAEDPKDRPVIPRDDSCGNPACTASVGRVHVLDGKGQLYCSASCVEFAYDIQGRRLDDA